MARSRKAIIVIFILVFLSLETKDLNAWNLFDKKFDSYDQCQQYVLRQTNDFELVHLAVGIGCNNLYPSIVKIHLPDGTKVDFKQDGAPVKVLSDRLARMYPSKFSALYERLILPDGSQVWVAKGYSGRKGWNMAYQAYPSAFDILRWSPNQQFVKFGQCLINAITDWTTDNKKYNGLIKCGDGAGMDRSLVLTLADRYSPDTKTREGIQRLEDAIRKNQFDRENNRGPLNCIWIGEILNCH
jgi:hypothetical protein